VTEAAAVAEAAVALAARRVRDRTEATEAAEAYDDGDAGCEWAVAAPEDEDEDSRGSSLGLGLSHGLSQGLSQGLSGAEVAAAHYRAARRTQRDAATQSALALRCDTRQRLLRRLAKAEQLHEPDEAQRARLLLKRAATQQQVYDRQFKQSDATRERRSSQGQGQGLIGGGRGYLLFRSSTSGGGAGSGINGSRPAESQQQLRASVNLGSGGLRPSSGAKTVLRNFPILDAMTGQWRGVWDLFQVSQ